MEYEVKPRDKNFLRGVILVLLGGICWGFSGTCGQYIFTYTDVDTGAVATIRLLSAGTILFVAALIKSRPQMKGMLSDKKDIWVLLFFTVFGIMLCQYTYLMAIHYTNSGTATVLQYTGPVFVLVFICVKLKRLPTKKETVSIFCALIGVFIMATHGDPGTLAISPKGIFWGILSAIMLMFYNVIPEGLLARWGSTAVSAVSMVLGGIIMFFCTGFWNLGFEVTKEFILGMTGMVLFGTVLSNLLFLRGLQDVGPTKASMLCSIEPVAAVFFAAAWMKTKFVPIDFLGIAFILTTVLLLAKKDESKKTKKAAVLEEPVAVTSDKEA